MDVKRINNAIEIINYAIKNLISVKEASVKCGYSDTYVKNIKALVYENYENGTLEDEYFNLFNEAHNKYIQSKNSKIRKDDVTERELLTSLNGVQGGSDNGHYRPSIPITAGERIKFDAKGNEAEIIWNAGDNYPADHIKTLDQLLTACQVDLNIWKVKDYTVNKWDVTSTKGDKPQTFQNFQVKARLEKNIENVKAINAAEIFIELTKNYNPPVLSYNKRVYNSKIENNLLEISLFDLHLGKLAWGGETGENYDTKIARKRFLYTIETLIERASGFPYSRILFPVGSDFFNSDTIDNTTTKGTFQDEDLRWKKTFKFGIQLVRDAISILKQTGVPVDILIIQGNHDEQRTTYLGECLEGWYHNDDMVNINNDAPSRKFYKFGKVLLGFTHGNEEKESALPLIMATDKFSKPMWSETIFHEWHVGHIHRQKTKKYAIADYSDTTTSEDLGVVIKYLPSLTGTEAWHYKKGYIGAQKAGDGFIWNDELGLIANLHSNIVFED